MRCSNGLAVPGTDTRFFQITTKRPISTTPGPSQSFDGIRYPSRVRFGSLKAKASINYGIVKEELSLYELLGIPESGTLFEIKQAYKQLARKYHPDVSPPDRVGEYTERFIRVHEAYEILSDPSQKAMYDRDLVKGIHFAFSASRRYRKDEVMEEKNEWKNNWEVQLWELKRRSMNNNNGRENMSWGARMRMQREEMKEQV